MAYVSFEYFNSIYPGAITEAEFGNLEYEARRVIDAHTTGVDNVRKLREAFPLDEDDAEAVKRCMCKLIRLLHDIEAAEKYRGLVQRGDGTVTGGVVSSVSSGSESISYAIGGTSIDEAVGDVAAKNRLLSQTVRQALSGVSDANGISLLFLGRYPRVF